MIINANFWTLILYFCKNSNFLSQLISVIEEQKISHTLQFLIEERNVKAVSEAISEVEAVDIANIFEILEEEDQKFLYEIMDNERSAEVLLYIDEDERKKFLRNFSTKEIADNIINEIDSDDAADIIAELPEYQQDEIIQHLNDEEHA